MAFELLGRKLGMTQIFDEAGDRIPVTVVSAGPCVVVQKKTPETDGYCAVQLGYEEKKEKHTSRPMQGHFRRAGVPPQRFTFELRMSTEEAEALELGQEIDCEKTFADVKKVDVTGVSRGRGFSGVIRRWHFATARKTHGTHEFFRHAGAISAGTYPGRVLPGKKMAGQHGSRSVTTVGLELQKIDGERNLLFIRGAVPGHRRGLVRIRPSTHLG